LALQGSIPQKVPNTPFQLSEAWLDNNSITACKTQSSLTVLSDFSQLLTLSVMSNGFMHPVQIV